MGNKFIILFFSLFFINACCTKKDCSSEELPSILIVFNKHQNTTIYLTEKTQFTILDSIKLSYRRHFAITDYLFKNSPIRNYNYIIKTATSQDTVSNVHYDRVTETIACNSCFPIDNPELSKSEITVLKNFQYRYNGTLHNGLDTVYINN